MKNRELLQIKPCIIEVTVEFATKGVVDLEYNGFFFCHGLLTYIVKTNELYYKALRSNTIVHLVLKIIL